MEAVAIDLEGEANLYKSLPSKNNPCTIYKVPETICEVDTKAYKPQIISIGPYHQFSGDRLLDMESYKKKIVDVMVSRNSVKKSEYYLEKLRPLVKRAKSCYSVGNDMSEYEFAEMMLLDGCFILELLLNVNKKQDTIEMSPICNSKWMVSLIGQDMLLLENQLPFFVIEELHKESSDSSSLVDLAKNFFDRYFFQRFLPRNEAKSPPKEVHHLLHLFHALLLPSDETSTKVSIHDPNPTYPLRWIHSMTKILRAGIPCMKKEKKETDSPTYRPRWIPSVTEIQRAGIKFMKKETDSLLDIAFQERPEQIQIPQLSIYDSITNTLFRNLIAFEQFHPESGSYFKSYTIFMHCILEKEGDVTELKQKRIIEHWLGSDKEVVNLFTQMCKGIVIDFEGNYLYNLFTNVAQSCEDDWSTLRATLIHKYFNTPWALFQLQATVFTILFAAVQTFLAVLAYYRPSK